MLFEKVEYITHHCRFFIMSILSSFAADVILGGQSIGIELDYEGVMITGTYEISIDNHPYDPASDGFMSGDLITKVNHQDVESIQELMNEIKDCVEKKQEIILTLQRQKTNL